MVLITNLWLCGSVELLGVAEEADLSCNERAFGEKVGISDYSKSVYAALVSSASSCFKATMLAICPTNPQAAFNALKNSLSFQKEWMPQGNPDQLLESTLVQGLVEAHHNAETKQSKLAILSLFAPYYEYRAIGHLFSVDHNDVHKARLYAAEGLAGVQLERLKHRRFKMDPQKFSFLHQWTKSTCACQDGDAGQGGTLQRLDIRLRLYQAYVKHARDEGVLPASQSHFYEVMGDGFEDQNSENCCCMQCIEGWNHLALVKDSIHDLSNGLKNF